MTLTTMDIIRDTKPQKRRKKLVWSVVGVGVIALTIFLPKLLPPAAPSVDASTGPFAVPREHPPPQGAYDVRGPVCTR